MSIEYFIFPYIESTRMKKSGWKTEIKYIIHEFTSDCCSFPVREAIDS